MKHNLRLKPKPINLKYLPVMLALVLVLTNLLTACSVKNASPIPLVHLITRADGASEAGDFTILKDFVNAINNQQLESALNLFNEEGALAEFDEVAKESNFHQNGYYHHYSGKAEIKDWLRTEIEAIPYIEVAEYKLSGIFLIMNGTLYYQDQKMDFQLTAQTQNGRIELLIYSIVIKNIAG